MHFYLRERHSYEGPKFKNSYVLMYFIALKGNKFAFINVAFFQNNEKVETLEKVQYGWLWRRNPKTILQRKPFIFPNVDEMAHLRL